VIPSANPFTIGADEIDPEVMSDPIRDESGLDFTIDGAHAAYMLGEPVVVNLRLRSFDRRGRRAHANPHPRTSGTTIAIARPDRRVVRFKPLVDHLMSDEPKVLGDGEEFEESAYIGFGEGGLYFDQPGIYKIRAIYHAPDGSRVMSNVANLRVRHPASAEDNDVADLLLGEEQGALFALLGSDAESLKNGNNAFQTVLAKHGRHALANYVRFVTGVNAARTFKTLDPATASLVRVRKSNLSDANSLLTAAVADASRVDNLSKSQGLAHLARAQELTGDTVSAAATRSRSQSLRNTRP
jgi:hypothetical protein